MDQPAPEQNMSRPRLINGRQELVEKVTFDGYDFGILLQYVEGANRLFLERDGFYIRRAEHPHHRYWRLPKGKLLDDLNMLFHRLMELTESRFNESWQTFSAKFADAQQSPDQQAFTWGLTFRIAPLAQGGHSVVWRLSPWSRCCISPYARRVPWPVQVLAH